MMRYQITNSNELYLTLKDEMGSYKQVLSLGKGLTDAVQAVESHSLKGPPHHGILLQHLIEIVHRERVEATVGVCSHTGRPSATGQQTDLWKVKERPDKRRTNQKMAD